MAESMTVRWAQDTGIPGSGWKNEGPNATTDATNATLKLLSSATTCTWVRAFATSRSAVREDFNRHDGLLMSIKDHTSTSAPKPRPNTSILWYPTLMDPRPAAIAGLHRQMGHVATRHSAHTDADRQLGRSTVGHGTSTPTP